MTPGARPPRGLAVPAALAVGLLVLPVVALVAFVIGSIYTGIATATEAAAIGVVGAKPRSRLMSSISAKV